MSFLCLATASSNWLRGAGFDTLSGEHSPTRGGERARPITCGIVGKYTHNRGFNVPPMPANLTQQYHKAEADYDKPYTIPRAGTVRDVAQLIHQDLAANLKYARIWSLHVHPGQSGLRASGPGRRRTAHLIRFCPALYLPLAIAVLASPIGVASWSAPCGRVPTPVSGISSPVTQAAPLASTLRNLLSHRLSCR